MEIGYRHSPVPSKNSGGAVRTSSTLESSSGGSLRSSVLNVTTNDNPHSSVLRESTSGSLRSSPTNGSVGPSRDRALYSESPREVSSRSTRTSVRSIPAPPIVSSSYHSSSLSDEDEGDIPLRTSLRSSPRSSPTAPERPVAQPWDMDEPVASAISRLPRKNLQQSSSYAEPSMGMKLRRGDEYFPKQSVTGRE
jgi:hypothetical protein